MTDTGVATARTVGDLMARGVLTASPDDHLCEVRDLLATHRIGALPVLDENEVLVGIVTADDLVPDFPAALPVHRIMSSPVATLGPDATARDAAALMRSRRCHHLVVLDEGRVVGMLSAFDLIGLVLGTV